MSVCLKGRSFLTLRDYTAEEIEYLVDLAIDLKDKKRRGIFEKNMANKNVALIFENLLHVHVVHLLSVLLMKVHIPNISAKTRYSLDIRKQLRIQQGF